MSMRFYDSAGTLGLYSDFGGLRTSSTTTYTTLDPTGLRMVNAGIERVHLSGTAGLELQDTAGVVRVNLSATGGLKTTGATGVVMLDDSGIGGYNSTTTFDNSTQVVKIDRATGKLVTGSPVGARMEADRTSIRFHNAAQVQQFSIIDGVLTTGTADTGGRVRMDSAGIKAYDVGGLQSFSLSNAGLLAIGQPSPARRMEADRTSLRFYDDSNVQQFSVINGVMTTGTADSGARVRIWSGGIAAYDSTSTQRFLIDAAQGVITLRDTAAVARLQLSTTGGLKSMTGTGGTVLLDDTGIGGYTGQAMSAAEQTFKLDRATGLLTLGVPSPGRRMEADRTSLRFFNDSNIQQFSIINGVLTTGTADANARVRMDSAGLLGYDAGGLQTFALSATTGLLTLGNVSPGARMEADRTSFRYFNSSNAQTFSIINGVLTTGAADVNARVRMDNLGIKAYNAGGVNTVAINSDGSAYFRGNIDLSNSTYTGTVSGATLITPGSITFSQLNVNVAGGNLMPNSSFDHPVTYNYGWSASGTPSVETTIVHNGGQAARITATATGGYMYNINSPVTESKPYMASAWVWAPTARSLRVTLYGYPLDKSASLGSLTNTIAVPATTWTRIVTGPYTMPATAVWARITIQDTTMLAGDYFIIDDTQVEEGDIATAWAPPAAEILPGTTIQSNPNANVSKVMMDLNGFRAYDASGPTVNISNTGVIDLGPTTVGHVTIDRTSMRFYQTDGTTVGLYARAGIISTASTGTGARVEMDGTGTTDKFAVYSSTQERVTLEGVQGLTLRDSSGIAKLYLSALGGLTTVAADTANRVTLNGLGLWGFDTGGLQSFKLDSATGLLTLGQPSPARRLEADRTSFRFFTDGNVQNFSIINGVLTTGAADSAARIRLDNTSLQGFDATGQMFSLTTAGTLTLGAPSGASRIEVDRTSMRFYNFNGTTVGLYARSGMISTNATGTGSRIDIDGVNKEIAIWGSTSAGPLVTMSGAGGAAAAIFLRDAATGNVGLTLAAAGGLTTYATENYARVTLDSTGLMGYNTSNQQTFQIASADGKLTIGTPLGQRMEATRTTLGFYSSTNLLQLSLGASGGLTTQAAETAQRVTLSSAGLVSYSSGNLQTVLIDAATGKIVIGPPTLQRGGRQIARR